MSGRVAANDYLDILNDEIFTIASILLPNIVILQDDNAPIHRAKKVQSWFNEHQNIIKHLSWPAQSPDLNIIETIWGFIYMKYSYRFINIDQVKTKEMSIREILSSLTGHGFYSCYCKGKTKNCACFKDLTESQIVDYKRLYLEKLSLSKKQINDLKMRTRKKTKVKNVKRAFYNEKVQPAGLIVDINMPFLAASPDNVIDNESLVEIKCPASAKELAP
ncbi:Restriction endonuclease type II-like,Exonuclease, phage-type/RecB, C-terminal [Cinara cedri]|uniref:Restriction endonuclease type II-like,Exonuclease, phage-type/RecB, C-terminal n=1 Tax=Cinara cedri TaxID=506608 RepID=A0A5E4MCP9_9HEMI|nr:Restriction endonuclease type II-like,Exonuclease, phage-type/RecB, C-terminal [Cinara cedri]